MQLVASKTADVGVARSGCPWQSCSAAMSQARCAARCACRSASSWDSQRAAATLCASKCCTAVSLISSSVVLTFSRRIFSSISSVCLAQQINDISMFYANILGYLRAINTPPLFMQLFINVFYLSVSLLMSSSRLFIISETVLA